MQTDLSKDKNSLLNNLKKVIPWRFKRYYMYIFVTIMSLLTPWITINGNHFFLFSFDHKMLNLMFVRFDMQELYLMPFLLMMVFLTIFWLTVVGGRVFCGWICPQTIFRVVYRDFIETKLLGLRKRVKNKQKEPDYSLRVNRVKRVLAILIWSILAMVAAMDLGWYFIPPEEFFQYIQYPNDHPVMIGALFGLTLFLIADIVFIKENFCVYVCPYSRIQSVLYDDDTLMSVYDYKRGGAIYDVNHNLLNTKPEDSNAECTGCQCCVTVCPTHIDIRKGLQLECINCLECVDACTTVMGKLGKESLVRWSSSKEAERYEGKTNFYRPKTVGGAIVLSIIFIIMIYIASTKEHMLLSVNKESRLYNIQKTKTDTVVKNSYVFLFSNTSNKSHKFYFEILGRKDIQIERPAKEFTIEHGFKKKKVVVLRTADILASDLRRDTSIPITIRAYAIDDRQKITVDRNAIFVYPRLDKIKP